jgi:hypothetical protein
VSKPKAVDTRKIHRSCWSFRSQCDIHTREWRQFAASVRGNYRGGLYSASLLIYDADAKVIYNEGRYNLTRDEAFAVALAHCLDI